MIHASKTKRQLKFLETILHYSHARTRRNVFKYSFQIQLQKGKILFSGKTGNLFVCASFCFRYLKLGIKRKVEIESISVEILRKIR